MITPLSAIWSRDGFLMQGGLQANTLYAVVYDEAGRATLERAAGME